LLRNLDVEIEGHDDPAAIPRRLARGPSQEEPMSTNNKATVASRTLLFTKIIAAITQYITAAIVLGGKSLTPQALTAMFQSYLQAEQDLDAARLVVAAKQQARDAAYAPLVGTLPALEKYLAATYGEESTTFASFGLSATKTGTRSAESVAAAVAKGKATRAAHKAAKAAPVPVAAPVVKS
jgi:hypothetical protein